MVPYLDRRQSVVLLSLLCLAIAFQPIVLTASNYWEVYPGWSFKPSNSYGDISFNSIAYFDGCYFQDDYVYFENLRFPTGYVWNYVAFRCTNNANMTISKLNRYDVRVLVDAPNGITSNSRILFPDNRQLRDVGGATAWSQTNNLVVFSVDHTSPQEVVMIWRESAVGSDLLGKLSSDLIGGIIGEYTALIGPVWGLFIVLGLFLPLVNRIGPESVIILSIMFWGTFFLILPATALNVGIVIIILVGASILTVLFFARRRQYG